MARPDHVLRPPNDHEARYLAWKERVLTWPLATEVDLGLTLADATEAHRSRVLWNLLEARAEWEGPDGFAKSILERGYL